MLSSIHPLGERVRHNRWPVTASAFVVGSMAGGTAMGAAAGSVGALAYAAAGLDRAVVGPILAALIIASSVLFDLKLLGLRLPTTRRQVDENWLTRYRGWVYGLGYGFQLGLGVVTVVATAAVYAAVALAAALGSVGLGAMVGGAFGLVRGLAILPGRTATSADRLRRLHRRLDARRLLADRLAATAEFVVAVALLAGIVGA